MLGSNRNGGEDDRDHVQTLARLSPQRLQRVHRPAIALDAYDLAIGTGDGGAGRQRNALADRPAGSER